MTETLQSLWDQLLEFTGQFVVPDWDWLVSLLPFAAFLLVGGALTLAVLAWLVYLVRRPRTRVRVDEDPRLLERDADGRPIAPPGEPFCVRDAILYPLSTLRCDRCADLLTVTCPMCGLARTVDIATCANCGLVLRIDPNARTRVVRPAGPPPGGAAVA